MAHDVDDVDALSGAIAAVETGLENSKARNEHTDVYNTRKKNGLSWISKSVVLLCKPLKQVFQC